MSRESAAFPSKRSAAQGTPVPPLGPGSASCTSVRRDRVPSWRTCRLEEVRHRGTRLSFLRLLLTLLHASKEMLTTLAGQAVAVGDNTLATGTVTSADLGAVTKASGLMAEAGQPLAEHRPDDEGRIRAALLSSRRELRLE